MRAVPGSPVPGLPVPDGRPVEKAVRILYHHRIIPDGSPPEACVEVLDRITQQPGVMGGKPCIRGTRVTVGTVVNQIAAGQTMDELLADYPYLEREDVQQALRYAAWRAEEREIILNGA